MREKSINIMMKHKKLLTLILVILIFRLGSMITNVFDDRPFRFEDFESAEELKIFLEEKYPIGSDGDIAFKDLVSAGAECRVVSNENAPNDIKKYHYIAWCEYSTGWISLPPKEQYQIIIMGNIKHEIREYSVGKYSGLVI